jgi:hypothetical protein
VLNVAVNVVLLNIALALEMNVVMGQATLLLMPLLMQSAMALLMAFALMDGIVVDTVDIVAMNIVMALAMQMEPEMALAMK